MFRLRPENRLLSIWFAALSIVSLAPYASAQQTTGTLQGIARDGSGAVIPSATVTILSDVGSQSVRTKPDGFFTSPLQPGTYSVHVEYKGFSPFEKRVDISPGRTTDLQVVLTVATGKQEVTVTGEAGQSLSVDADQNATSMVMKGDDLASLPDDPSDLSDMLTALAGPGAGPNGTEVYIDGFSGGQLPAKASIKEIRMTRTHSRRSMTAPVREE